MNYKFIGDGMGVPGLAHEISEEEAEKLGVGELLKAAIENGSYTQVDDEPTMGTYEKRPSTAASTPPLRTKKGNEVKHG